MDQTGRLYKIDQLLRQHKVISFAALQAELKVSRATLKRDLDDLRKRLKLPIEWSRAAGGYRLAALQEPRTSAHELPGLWFSPAEIQALLTLQHLLACLDTGGLILNPVSEAERLMALLQSDNVELQELRERVRIVGLEREPATPRYFERVGQALVRRKRLLLTYTKGELTLVGCEVSPLRMVSYQGVWYLEVWCHGHSALHSVEVAAIIDVQVLGTGAVDMGADKLDAAFGPLYGIYPSGRVRWARLQFGAEHAAEAAHLQWHSQQQGRVQQDGSYLLRVPYMDHRELMGDILRHGARCVVLGPASLRQALADEVAKMSTAYQTVAPLDEPEVVE